MIQTLTVTSVFLSLFEWFIQTINMQEAHICYSSGNVWFCESLNDSFKQLTRKSYLLDSSCNLWVHESLWMIYSKYQLICMWLELHRLHCFWFTKKELLISVIYLWKWPCLLSLICVFFFFFFSEKQLILEF